MTLYAWILFSHVAGAFFVFAGLALEWIALGYLRRPLDRGELGRWIHVAGVAQRFYGPAIGVVPFSGGYLASKMGGKQGWILVSFVTLIVIGLIGLVFTSGRVRAIGKAAKESAEPTAIESLLHDAVLSASVRVRIALVLGVLLLMVSKVSLRLSLVTIACAASLGLLAVLPAWRRAAMPRTKSAS